MTTTGTPAIADPPPRPRGLVGRLAAISDGAIMRAAFFALLAGTIGVLYVDYRELDQNTLPQSTAPLQPILPPASDGPDTGAMPEITSDPAMLQQPLDIALGPGGELSLSGTIDPGAALRFAEEIAARGEYVAAIVLDSPGGSVTDALAMADLIHEKGLSTTVRAGALCASSCPLIFAAGTTRSASPGAAIGVHQIYAAALSGPQRDALEVTGVAMSSAQTTTAQIITMLTRSGVDPALWLHALQTPPERMYYFTPQEMDDLDLVTNFMEN